MVDEIRDRGLTPGVTPRSETPGSRAPGGGIDHLVGRTRETQDAKTGRDPFGQVTQQVRELKGLKAQGWSKALVRRLSQAIKATLDHRRAEVASQGKVDDYALETATNAVRIQLREAVRSLSPPPEIAEADDFQELMELLWPPSIRRKGASTFKAGTGLQGNLRSGVRAEMVRDAVRDAARKAGQKMMQQQNMSNPNMGQFAKMSLEQMARLVQRRMRKLKKGKVIDESGQISEDASAEEVDEARELQAMMEMFSQKALMTMRLLREEIAPRWAPEQQPWLLQEADRQVYDILLAAIPKELFEETEAWQEIQDLRAGQEVFTLRAADKLTEAAGRG